MPRRTTCPLCDNSPSTEHTPFCGQGCRDRDLLKWLGEGYRIPGERVDPDGLAGAQSGLDSTDDRN